VNVNRSRFSLHQVQAVVANEVLDDGTLAMPDFLEQEQEAMVIRLARATRESLHRGTPISRSVSRLATAQRSVPGPGPRLSPDHATERRAVSQVSRASSSMRI
jgi:hypothetical protein